MKAARLDGLIWALIYGGIFMVMLGLWVIADDAGLGHGLSWTGSLFVAVGVLLIWRRSRRDDGAAPPDEGKLP
jgi:hypothetical protein